MPQQGRSGGAGGGEGLVAVVPPPAAAAMPAPTMYAVVTGCTATPTPSLGFVAAKSLAIDHGYKVVLACRDEVKGQQAASAINDACREHYERARRRGCDGINGESCTSAGAGAAKYLHLDLASFASVRDFSRRLRSCEIGGDGGGGGTVAERGIRLLVNAAGVAWGGAPASPDASCCYRTTEDGLEEIVGVNHFGHYLLTNLLLDDLRRGAAVAAADAAANADGASASSRRCSEPSRVVVVGSSLHDLGKSKNQGNSGDGRTGNSGSNSSDDAQQREEEQEEIPHPLLLPSFPDGIIPADDDSYRSDGGKRAYRLSKLYNLWFAYELQRRLHNDGGEKVGGDGRGCSQVVVNAVTPGFVPSTGLGRRSFGGGFGGDAARRALRFVEGPLRSAGVLPSFVRTAEEGGRAIVLACVGGGAAAKGGRYLHLPLPSSSISSGAGDEGDDLIPISSSEESYDEVKAGEFWRLSAEICHFDKGRW